MREISKALMACETFINKVSAEEIFPAFAVAEKLRPHLANLMGIGGFRALLSRALAVATEEVPWLREVQVSKAGKLEGLERAYSQLDHTEFSKGAEILISQLLGLLVAFIGFPLTLQQITEIWPGSSGIILDSGEEVQSEKTN